MTHGFLPRTAICILLPTLAVLLAGCNTSLQRESYPSYLQYPQRTDLIVETPSEKQDVKKLPPPGDLDDAIAKGIGTGEKGKAYSPDKLDKAEAAQIRKMVDQLFGTPAAPQVVLADAPEKGTPAAYWLQFWIAGRSLSLDGDPIGNLLLDKGEKEINERLQRGSKLYRRHCLHCHGLAGDGRGPTGPWVHPHPRDYRSGAFKFLSTSMTTGGSRKPRRDDLLRILRNGIDGTSMPAFALLPESELEYLASYVMHLSIRGQAERGAMLARLEKKGEEPRPIQEAQKQFPDVSAAEHQVYSNAAQALVDWALSNSAPPLSATGAADLPPDSPEMQKSIERGYLLFISDSQGGCLKCHNDFGRQAEFRFDVWGTHVRPANLTTGTYRGGRRPMDIMNRLKGGIEPSGMPASAVKVMAKDGQTVDQEATDRANWDLVNFVRALPYPAMLPKETVRDKIYGASERKK